MTSGPARRFVLDLGAQARLYPADGGEVWTVAEGRASLEELRRLYPGG